MVELINVSWFHDDRSLSPWYRGVGRADYPLQPGLFRTGMDEDELREEVTLRAPALSGHKSLDHWEWYFVMQHHGAPTRLLDWSDGALLGLLFALRSNEGKSDAAVWVLDPWWLNEHIAGTGLVYPAGHPRTRRWLRPPFSSEKLPKLPVAIFPPHITSRMSAQHSCFTIHGADPDGLERVSEMFPNPHIRKVVIPQSSILTLRIELDNCGIVETTLFPELDGLSRELVRKWLSLPKTPYALKSLHLQSNGV
jgi:hypothetical protein